MVSAATFFSTTRGLPSMLHGICMGLSVGVGRESECEAVDRAGKRWCEAAAGSTHVTHLRIIELKFLAPE